MSGTNTELNFNIREIPEGMDANAMITKMRTGVALTPEEMDFTERHGATIMGSLRIDVFPNLSEHDKTSFDRMFIGNRSVEDLCRERTEGMKEEDKEIYMRCFVATEAMARDSIISYAPPLVEYGYGDRPLIYVTTMMHPADIEKERPKPGFFRRIGEALGILKPLPSPQQEYEDMLKADSNSPARNDRIEEIKAAIKQSRADAVEKEMVSIQEMEAENKVKADATKQRRRQEMKADGAHRTPQERLKDLQDARSIYMQEVTFKGDEIPTRRGVPISEDVPYKRDYFIHVSPIEEGSTAAKDNPEAIIELQKRTKKFYFEKSTDGMTPKYADAALELPDGPLEASWQCKDPRELKEGEAFTINMFNVSRTQAAEILHELNGDIKELEAKINPLKTTQEKPKVR